MRRWATSLSDAPPRSVDEVWAESHLNPGETALWRSMSNADRRHSVVVARRFVEPGVEPGVEPSRAEVAGALLHDVGKVASNLGTWGRVSATLIGGRGRRFRAYRDHESIGAEMCRAAGSHETTVELVAGRGTSVDRLRRADNV